MEDGIYGLDINDELTRQEPWAYNERNDKLFIDALINGRAWVMPNWSRKHVLGAGNGIDSSHNLIMMQDYHYWTSFTGNANPFARNSTARFIERVGLFNYEAVYEKNDKDDEGVGAMSGGEASRFDVSHQTQSTTTFIDDKDHYVGTIVNEDHQQKKVIQYIYIES